MPERECNQHAGDPGIEPGPTQGTLLNRIAITVQSITPRSIQPYSVVPRSSILLHNVAPRNIQIYSVTPKSIPTVVQLSEVQALTTCGCSNESMRSSPDNLRVFE